MFSPYKIIILFITVIPLITSCNKEPELLCRQGSGQIISEIRFTEPFKEVDLQLPGKVFISKGDDYKITLETYSNLLNIISTEVVGDKILISSTECFNNNIEVIARITVPEINNTFVNSSGNITITDKFINDTLNITISGSGNVNFETDAQNVNAYISGSGNINLSGYAQNISVDITGSGNLNAFNLITQEAEININGSGSSEVNVTEKMKVRISGNGNVFYKGNPDITSEISGNGKLIKVD